MAADLILKASSVITMDPDRTRGEAVAIDTGAGTIAAIGSLQECQAAAPDAKVEDLGSRVLMPGFIEPHNHPVLSGVVTQEPAHWIAPWEGFPTYADVEAKFKEVDSEAPAGEAVVFCGLDRLLQGAPELNNTDLDRFFPNRPVIVLDNSGHELYFNTTTIELNGWKDNKPPADPTGARFGRNEDGTSNGRAYETAAILASALNVMGAAVPHPLLSSAKWLAMMARNGITATTEHTYETKLLKAYNALLSTENTPIRLALYHMSIESDCGEKISSPIPEQMLWKQGIKLWADGSPWVGTIAASFPYLDDEVTRKAQIPLGPGGEEMMNYTRLQLDQVLDQYAGEGWQFAFHVNGDIGIDMVLDSYEATLSKHGLLGSDHRWRLEHCGAGRADQFDRVAAIGATVSLLTAQFIYWGDLLDGQLFEPAIGSQWIQAGSAFKAGIHPTFHNDGCVSPPIPLLNIQSMVTRTTINGNVHGPEQAVSLDDALVAHTVNAAWQIGRDHDLGSLEPGKLADIVELSADPYEVDPLKLTDEVKVEGTWRSGKRIDLDAFLKEVEAVDPTEHKELAHSAAGRHVCSHGGSGHSH